MVTSLVEKKYLYISICKLCTYGELLYRRRSKVLWEGLNVKWHPLVGSVSISDWPFKAAEAAVHLSNWLRTLQLPQLTRDCSQMCNKIQFGMVLCKDVTTLDFPHILRHVTLFQDYLWRSPFPWHPHPSKHEFRSS